MRGMNERCGIEVWMEGVDENFVWKDRWRGMDESCRWKM